MEGSSFGGGLRAFLQLARGLDPKIFEPFFACLPGGLLHRKIIESNIIFIPVDFSKKINPGLIGRLNRIFKRIKPDIVHSQALRIDFYARLAARMAGIPAVFSTIAVLVGDSGAGGIKRPVYRIMDWISRKCVTRFCVVSKHIRDKMIHAYNVDPKNIRYSQRD